MAKKKSQSEFGLDMVLTRHAEIMEENAKSLDMLCLKICEVEVIVEDLKVKINTQTLMLDTLTEDSRWRPNDDAT